LGNQFDRLNPAVGIFADCVNNLIIDNCKAFHMYGDGIFLRYVQEGLIKNTQAERNGGNGFVFDNCDVTCVQSCKAEQNCYNGFHEVACAGDNSYSNCTAKQNGVHGFRVIGSGKTIDSCIANQNTLDGFFFVGPQNSTVDGSLDITFGGDGKTTIDFGGIDAANAVAIQKDGKIVSAGSNTLLGLTSFALARQNSDGSLDNSFDVNGLVTVPFIGSLGSAATGVALQDDGKIVAVGYNQTVLGFDFAAIRLLSDGSLDTSFDGDGRVTTDLGGTDDLALAVAIQKDGKMVVAGYSNVNIFYEFALARYNVDGSLDFSTTTSFGGVFDQAFALALQKNGKIVVAGLAEISGTLQFALARYNTDGTLDTSFGTGGKVTTSFGNLED
jgi:uncharacterized delta-60 repeat protein